ncbi:MAG: hypothetical protein ACE5GR_03860, partial [Nitrosopumilus sp.]
VSSDLQNGQESMVSTRPSITYIHKKSISFMSERITVMLDQETITKLRELQAKKIKENKKSVSFSKVINEVLQKSLKK